MEARRANRPVPGLTVCVWSLLNPSTQMVCKTMFAVFIVNDAFQISAAPSDTGEFLPLRTVPPVPLLRSQSVVCRFLLLPTGMPLAQIPIMIYPVFSAPKFLWSI